MAKPPPTTANPPLIRVLCANHADIIGRWGEAGKRLDRLGVRSVIIKALPPGFNSGLAQRAATDTINDPLGVLVISPASDPRHRPLFDELDQPTLLEFLILLKSSGRLAFMGAEDADTSQLSSALSDIPAFVLADPRSMELLAGWSRAALGSASSEQNAGGRANAGSEAGDDPVARMRALISAADASERAGDFSRAIEATAAALDLAARSDDHAAIGALSVRAAGLHLAAGDTNTAARLAQEGIALAERLGDTALLTRGQRVLGNVYAKLDDLRSAIELYGRALESARRAGDVQSQWLTLVELGDANRRMQRTSIALGAYQDALMLVQSLGDPKVVEFVRARIVAVSGETQQAQPHVPSPRGPGGPRERASTPPGQGGGSPDSLPISALSSLSLSPAAQAILDRAKAMTPPGGRWSTLSTLAFLFATKELGRETPQNEDTIHFVHRYIDRVAASAYQTLYESTVRTWIEDSPPDVGTDQPPGAWVETITANVQRMFERARAIAEATVLEEPAQRAKQSYTTMRDPGIISARHLFAALLTFDPGPGTPNNVISKLTGLGLNVAAMKSAFFEVITANTPEDNSSAWREVLGLPAPSVQSAAVPATNRPSASPPADWVALSTTESLRLSPSFRKVLDKARSLAETYSAGPAAAISPEHLLFALAEIGGRAEDGVSSARWFRGFIEGSEPQRYQQAFNEWTSRLGAASSKQSARAEHLTPTAAAILTDSARLAQDTRDPQSIANANIASGAEVHARHLLGAILSGQRGPEVAKVSELLGFSRESISTSFYDYLRSTGINDNFDAWSKALGLSTSAARAKSGQPSQAAETARTSEPQPLEIPERFQFSTPARAVLDLARGLVATIVPTGSAASPTDINSIALLFALAETGEKSGADTDAAAFRRYLRPGSAEPYYRARHHYFPQHHRALGGADQPDVSGVRSLSADALAVLDEARRIALLTNPNLLGLAGGDATIHPVHLAAALTTTAIADPAPPHRELLDGIGVPPADLARALAAGAMRGGPFTVVPGWKTALRPVLGDSIQELLPDAYRVKFDNDDNKTDKLNLRHEIDALAYLIAARAVQPPLAIGLFGEWGSGKSFFMSRLRERVNQIADAARAADAAARAQVERGEQPAVDTDKIEWHRHICQIEFNAWHYVEGNIWASLVEHIFSNLRSSLVSPKASAEAQRKQEEEFRREFETSKHALAELESRISSAQKDLDNAQAAVANARDNHRLKAGLLGELKSGQTALVVIRALLEKTDFVAALRELGMTDEVLNSPARVREEIQKLAAEGEAWKSPLSLLSGRAIGGRFMWIVLALLLLTTPLIVLAVTSLLSAFDREIKLIVGLSVQFAAVCTAVLGWISTQAGRLAKARAKLEPVMRQLEERRSEELVRTERDLSVAKSNLDQAVSDFAQQQKKVEELRAQEKAATATELMAQFIEQRAACTDYRRHLGITAIVRRDFAKLTELVAHRSAESRAQPVDELARQPIDRIVLYIDDLDRCPPDKVVAVLEAIHLILAFKLFVVVVGVDARWISHSLKKKYGSLLSGRAAGPGRPREPGARIFGEASHTPAAVPEDYLEKIFQVPFRLRSLNATGTRSLLEHLTKPPGPAAATARATPAAAPTIGTAPQPDAAARAPAARIVEPKHTAAAVPVPIPTTGRADTSAAPAASTPTGPTGTATPGLTTPAPPPGPAPAQTQVVASTATPPAVRAATTIPDNPAVELAPGLLQLTDAEVKFMMELAPVIGRSPRAVHRFVNCYRLLKAARDPRAVAAFETAAGDGSVPAYEAAMLMLGLVIGIPEIAAPALSMLVGRAPTAELSNLIADWDKDPRISSEPDWKQRIEPFFRKYAKARGKPCPISPFRDAATAVARYSFRTGMMEELEPAAQATP
ncbi:MAG: hypothetical protein IT436_06005 [Phycisphaerales bacterium]|nr:hypothetical protein [Phycisphaerales bacterium]